MTALNFDLTGNAIIEQNAGWQSVLFYPGDVRGARFRGQIRSGYTGPVVADFSFGEPVYNAEQNKSAIIMYLTGEQTRRIKPPEVGDVWRYDVLMKLGEEESVRLAQGIAEISLGVTPSV